MDTCKNKQQLNIVAYLSENLWIIKGLFQSVNQWTWKNQKQYLEKNEIKLPLNSVKGSWETLSRANSRTTEY